MARPKIPEEKYQAAFQQLLTDNHNDLSKLSPFMLQKAVGGRLENVNSIYSELFKTAAEQFESEQEAMPKPEWYMDEANEAGRAVKELVLGKWQGLSRKLVEHKALVEEEYQQKASVYQSRLEALTEHNRQASARIIELEEVEEALESMTTAFNQSEQKKDQGVIRLEEALKREEALKQQGTGLLAERDSALSDASTLQGQLKTQAEELDQEQAASALLSEERGKLQTIIRTLETQVKTEQDQFRLMDVANQEQVLLLEKLGSQNEMKDEQLETMATELSEQTRISSETQQALTKAETELAGGEDSIAELKAVIISLREEVTQLTRDNGSLSGQLSVLTKTQKK